MASRFAALEMRMLFDAAGMMTFSDVQHEAQEQQATALATDDNHDALLAALGENNLPAGQPVPSTVEVFFVDAEVADPDAILASIGHNAEVHVLHHGRDGLEQIADVLEGRSGISAIHIISHGTSGSLSLGSATLTAESITGTHAQELNAIGASLAVNADIFIYGCNFGAGDVGSQAVSLLAAATGADVAASDDATGAAALGGDWQLERTSGTIDEHALSATAWDGLLTKTVINPMGGAAADGSDGLRIHVMSNGQYQIQYHGTNQLYHPDLTDDDAVLFNGIYLSVGSTVVGPATNSNFGAAYSGPANGPGIASTDATFREGGQTFAGTGTKADPYTVTTTLFYDVNNNGVYNPATDYQVVVVTEYAAPDGYMTLRTSVTPPPTNTQVVKLYHSIDTFLSGGDNGPAFSLPQNLAQTNNTSGDPTLVGVRKDPGGPNDSFVGIAEAQGSRQFDHWFSGQYDSASIYGNGINNGGDIDNGWNTNPATDNGVAVQYTLGAITSVESWSYHLAFSSEASLDLDADNSSGAAGSAFSTTYTVGSGDTIPIVDADAQITNVAGDIQQVRITLSNPQLGDSLAVDVGALPAGVQVLSQTATQIVLSAVGVAQTEATFDTALQALGFTTSSSSISARSIQFAVTNELGIEGFASAGTIGINQPPNAQNDAFTVNEGGTLSANLFATNGSGSDTDAESDPFTITLVNGSSFTVGLPIALANGTLTITNAATGDFTFEPNATYVGGASFTYTITDPEGGTDTATASITVNNVNDAPSGADAVVAVTEDTPYTFSAANFGFTDPDDSPSNSFQSVTITTLPAAGTLLLSGVPVVATQVIPVASIGNLTWTPPLHGTGAGLSSFTFQVTDNGGTANGGIATDQTPNTITFNVAAVNDAPALDNDADNSSGQSGADFETTYVENSPSVSIVDTDVTILDVDTSTIEVAIIRLTNAFPNDSLQVGVMPLGIAAAVDAVSVPGEITVTLTGPASLADFEDALHAIRFLNTSETPDTTDRVVEITVNDGFANSNIGSTIINVIAMNDNPTLDLDGNNSTGVNAGNVQTAYTENGPGVSIGDIDVRIIDLDDSNIEGVTVTLTNGRLGDSLSVGTLPAGISIVGAAPGILATNGTITVQLAGSASLADYESAIEAIRFASNLDNIDPAQRVITVVVNDGEMNSNTSRAFVGIVPVNDAPAAAPDVATVAEDGVLSGTGATGLLANDFDIDGDGLNISGFSIAGDPTVYVPGDTATIAGVSTLLINLNGSYVFTPDTNFNGPVPEVTYSITDGQGGSASSTLNIDVSPVNDAPVAVDDGPVAVMEDTAVSGNVITDFAGADSDVDGDALTVTQFTIAGLGTFPADTLATIPNVGTLVVNMDGSYTFEPAADYDGAVPPVTYTVSDGTATATAALTFADITDVNDAPVAQDDNETTDEATVLADSLFTDNGNGPDADVDGDAILITEINGAPVVFGATVTLPSGALLVVNSDGSYSYNPNGVFEGLQAGETAGDSFTYTISDGSAFADTATVNLTIQGVNDAPIAQDDVETTDENTGLTQSVLANNGNGPDSDADGDTLTVSEVNGVALTSGAVITLPSGALLTMNSNGTYTYNPNGQFDSLQVGETATDSFTYHISDGNGGTDVATVTFSIAGVNDAPVATSLANVTGQDGDVIVPLDVSVAFSDADGDDLDYAATGLPPGLSIDPATGVITGTLDPAASVGGPYTVVVTATDPDGETATSSFEWNVQNRPPIAVADVSSGDEDAGQTGNLLDNDADAAPDSDAVTVASVNGIPALAGVPVVLTHGELTVSSSGAWSFAPNATANALAQGEVVTETITYQISDGQGGTDETTLTITLTGTNDAPVITPATDQTANDGETIPPLDVGALFADPDGDDLTFAANGLPPGLLIDADTGVITGILTPDASQGGPYTVVVTATDPNGNEYPVSFSWAVSNPAPVADDDPVVTDEDTSINIDVLGNDSDVDGDPLMVVAATEPAHGSVVINLDGSVTYTPDSNFHGTDTFSYTISDGNGGTSTATVSVVVAPVNDAPVSTPLANMSGRDGEVIAPLDVSVVFSDVDGDDLDYSATGLPPGLLIDPETGVITGTIDPAASVNGPYTVVVTAVDPGGATVTSSFEWTVQNLPPVATVDTSSGNEDAIQTGNVLSNDGDSAPDSDAVTVSAAAQGGNAVTLGVPFVTAGGGALTLNADGSYSFDPGTAYNDLTASETATEVITYTILDGQGGTDTATLTITVAGVNDRPVVIDPDNPGTPENPAPTPDPLNIIPDVSTTDGATPAPVNVGSYIVDPEGEPLIFTATGLPPGLVIDPGTGIISGTVAPDASLAGLYVVTVTASDPGGLSVETTVTYDIANVAPVAVDDAAAADEDSIQTGNVLTNPLTGDADAAPDSDALTVIGAEQAGNPIIIGVPFTTAGGGVLTLQADGSYSFVPGTHYNDLNLGEVATEVISYTVSDGQGGTDTATLSLTITGVNDRPVVVDPDDPGTPEVPNPAADPLNIIPDLSATDGSTPAPVDVAAYIVDPESEPLTFTATGLPTGLSIDPTSGVISGTLGPDASQSGPYVVIITATDPGGLSVQTTLTYTISNLPPVAVDDTSTGNEDSGQSGNVLTDATTGDADAAPDSDPLEVIAISGGTVGTPIALVHGSVTIGSDGTWSFTPNAVANQLPVGATVVETVSYTVSDGQGGTDTATLSITITGVNDAPIVVAPPPEQTNYVGENVSLNVSSAFADVDTGDVLTFTATGLPPGLSIDPATGIISGTLTLNANEGGPYVVVVSVADGHGGSASVSIDWDVKAQARTDDPGPEVSEAPKAIDPGPAVEVAHHILDTVNGIGDLNGTPALEDHVITQAVYGIASLNSATDLVSTDGVITRLVEWAGQQGRSASWILDLFDAMEQVPYGGDNLDLALRVDGAVMFQIKTVLNDGALYLGVDQFTDGAVVIGIIAGDGGAFPSHVAQVGAQDIVVNLHPLGGWLDLAVVGQLADGARVTWNISVNPQSGEIVTGTWSGRSPQEAELAHMLRSLVASTNRMASGGSG